MQLLNYFQAYCDIGFKVIPLHPFSKKPVFKNWQLNWDKNWCENYIINHPKSNLGFLLGEICDVEGDSEEANRTIINLIGDYKHPQYKSHKSIHHLFKNPDLNLTKFAYQHIEFRAYRHQSVLPPSKHTENISYNWLKGTKFPVPDMPEELLNYYLKITQKKPALKPGHLKPWCSSCMKQKYIHKKRYKLEKMAFKNLNLNWQCQTCRKIDIRENCRNIRCNLFDN